MFHCNEETQFGDETSDGVVGVAADLVAGKLLYSVNGRWRDPMGAAFEGLDTKGLELFPAVTGANLKASVNFGKNEFQFAPPDDTYKKLGELLSPV